ncbi:hypothetical protein BDP27DRAFT_1433523 [Rhodocollybia butyracea]|uniref:Uncharacterized protein n=1 Tax=Rhodocollybia butyracea TaxID=206335 RepID=A0A9P5P7R7_9AGAR|nr:hypothetical protein BDP27DRAFT_1433523 [Rhodocollybia butyracea]
MPPLPRELHQLIVEWLSDDLPTIVAWAYTNKLGYVASMRTLYRSVQCEAFPIVAYGTNDCSRFVRCLHFKGTNKTEHIAQVALDVAPAVWKKLESSQTIRQFHWDVVDPLSCVFPEGIPPVLGKLTVLKIRIEEYSISNLQHFNGILNDNLAILHMYCNAHITNLDAGMQLLATLKNLPIRVPQLTEFQLQLPSVMLGGSDDALRLLLDAESFSFPQTRRLGLISHNEEVDGLAFVNRHKLLDTLTYIWDGLDPPSNFPFKNCIQHLHHFRGSLLDVEALLNFTPQNIESLDICLWDVQRLTNILPQLLTLKFLTVLTIRDFIVINPELQTLNLFPADQIPAYVCLTETTTTSD